MIFDGSCNVQTIEIKNVGKYPCMNLRVFFNFNKNSKCNISVFEPNDKKIYTIIYPIKALEKKTENENYILLQAILENNSSDKIGLFEPQYQLTEACKPKHIIACYGDIDGNTMIQKFELQKTSSGEMYYSLEIKSFDDKRKLK